MTKSLYSFCLFGSFLWLAIIVCGPLLSIADLMYDLKGRRDRLNMGVLYLTLIIVASAPAVFFIAIGE